MPGSSAVDAKSKLDEIEKEVDENPRGHKEQAPKLQQLLADGSIPALDRARALRLLGVVRNRSWLYRDALASLGEAKEIAIAAEDYRELARIGRETAVVYAWRGDDRAAALALLHALAYAYLQKDDVSVARSLAELGRIEWEARRYASAARVLRMVATAAAKDLPKRQAQRVKVSLCQVLNQLGQHAEVLQWVRELKDELTGGERLLFLACLEEMKALAELGLLDAAEQSKQEAKALLTQDMGAFEHAEYAEAEATLAATKGGPSVEERLAKIAAQFDEQDLIVRAAEVRIQLARHLFKSDQAERAREVLSTALRGAIAADNLELAERLRAEMIKSADARYIEELAEDIEAIAGGSSLDRRFILLKRLGQGAFGVVHKAVDLRDGQQVALKRVFLDAVYSPARRGELLATIRNEYGAATRLPPYPGIARVRDILIQPGGTLYIVQDFIAGPSLRDLYVSGSQPARLLPLLADIADALAVLHAKRIVHRDLKPENVIVAEKGPVLIDFGIALLDGKKDVLKHYGTAGYMAPEQARGEKVDGRADIYSLGRMIVEACGSELGRTPSLWARIWSPEPASATPQSLRVVVREMLAEDPNNRRSDLNTIAEALRQCCPQEEQS